MRARAHPRLDPDQDRELSLAFLQIDGLTKRFEPGAKPAVDGVDLAIERGEFFALLGPSGCGKTTLLRMVAGFETPDAGAIAIDGADMAGIPPYRRPVNIMFQSYALFPHMSVARNVGFGLRQERLTRDAIAARVDAMLDLVQMRGFASRRPGQLSGGERQRVALARALVKEPKLLLLDEPLTALDRKLREETRFELKRIHQRVGVTFLMVTHDQEEAMSMASRLAVMNDGRIEQIGTPEHVYENPANRFVAGFLGAINLFEGQVAGSDGGAVLVDTDAGRLVATHAPLGAGSKVAVAVRPEKLRLAPTPSSVNTLTGTMRGVAYRGEASTAEIELANGRLLRVTVANTGGALPAPGTSVFLSFAPDAARVLQS
ncbi:MAG TPA: ABC transporter ATP-binding protein [Stellaceae bacterium]